MEDNTDAIKDVEEPLKNSSLTKNDENNPSEIDNLTSTNNDLRKNGQNTTYEKKSEINKNNLNASIKKDINNNNNQENIAEKTANTVRKDINKSTVINESESSKVATIKSKKEVPIEKKPFKEFVNDYLLPSLLKEFNDRGLEIQDISLKNTSRPIAGDKCWVIYCEIKDICNFWLSFEKEDISSLKSISLCKSNQRPSVIESFLIDEKRITLKLIISRIMQRLNGQKLIGVN